MVGWAPRKHPEIFEPLEDWDLFVLRHQNTANTWVHFFSFLLFWVSPVLGLCLSPWFFIGFFSSGLIGALGHWLFENGNVDFRETTSKPSVVYFSSAMCVYLLFNKYKREIQISKNKYERFMNKEILSVADPKLFSKLP